MSFTIRNLKIKPGASFTNMPGEIRPASCQISKSWFEGKGGREGGREEERKQGNKQGRKCVTNEASTGEVIRKYLKTTCWDMHLKCTSTPKLHKNGNAWTPELQASRNFHSCAILVPLYTLQSSSTWSWDVQVVHNLVCAQKCINE